MRRTGVDREDNPVPGKRPSNGVKKNKQRDRNTAFPVRSLSEERQYVIGQFPKKDLINEWRLDDDRPVPFLAALLPIWLGSR
jgi:hypothetical protein